MDPIEEVKTIMQNIIEKGFEWENEFGVCNKESTGKYKYKSINDFTIYIHKGYEKISFKILPKSQHSIENWHCFDGFIPIIKSIKKNTNNIAY